MSAKRVRSGRRLRHTRQAADTLSAMINEKQVECRVRTRRTRSRQRRPLQLPRLLVQWCVMILREMLVRLPTRQRSSGDVSWQDANGKRPQRAYLHFVYLVRHTHLKNLVHCIGVWCWRRWWDAQTHEAVLKRAKVIHHSTRGSPPGGQVRRVSGAGPGQQGRGR